jgi:hypothetical protein
LCSGTTDVVAADIYIADEIDLIVELDQITFTGEDKIAGLGIACNGSHFYATSATCSNYCK